MQNNFAENVPYLLKFVNIKLLIRYFEIKYEIMNHVLLIHIFRVYHLHLLYFYSSFKLSIKQITKKFGRGTLRFETSTSILLFLPQHCFWITETIEDHIYLTKD